MDVQEPKPASKYYRLFQYLRQQVEAEVQLTFEEIEGIIRDSLPPSARTGRSFWSNRSRGACQALAWLGAGYRIAGVDLARQHVRFTKAQLSYALHQENCEVAWDADLVRALREYLRLNQQGLADILGVRQQTISEWETGVYQPTRSRCKHLTLIAEQACFLSYSNRNE